MKETKHFVGRSSKWSGMLRIRRPKRSYRIWDKLYYNVGFLILCGMSALLVMFVQEEIEAGTSLFEFKRFISHAEEFSWNYSSYTFQPIIVDWDDQRAKWMDEHPDMRKQEAGRPRVLMVTSSSPKPSEPTILSHLLLRAGKNKLDYCRMHDMELYYSLGNPDPEFSDWWVKLPVIRMLMLEHPEVEWIWWLDADAILTDMSFEPPFWELEQHNLVLYGEHHLVYDIKAWTGLSTANYMIRNSQWSLDLLDEWASMGTDSVREEAGKFQSRLLTDRSFEFPGDDQAGLVAMLVQDKRKRINKRKWAPKVKLVPATEYSLIANWTSVGPKLEDLVQNEDQPVPFVTHFAGCLPSFTAKPEISAHILDACEEQLKRVFDFADNQVYQQLGFLPRVFGSPSEPLTKISSGQSLGKDADLVVDGNGDNLEVAMPPKVTDWDARRQAWMEKHPYTKREEVLLVSGSAPKPCAGKPGNHILVRGFKNLIDYGRTNGIRIFYNKAAVDKGLVGWWTKLPLLKTLMLNNPAVEWVWWMDSDAVFTDMDFRLPFARYNASGYNLVMYGSEYELFERKKFQGINTGNVLIRNCQWSFDLLDRWASFGATEDLRKKNDILVSEVLTDRGVGWDADDQSVLAYLLITERDMWVSQVHLEFHVLMSGYWPHWTPRFAYEMDPKDRPFVTHFAGCQPCGESVSEECLIGIDQTYNFADNQVLEKYGLRHEHLNSSKLQISSRVGTNLEAGEDGYRAQLLELGTLEDEKVTRPDHDHEVPDHRSEEFAPSKEPYESAVPKEEVA